MKHLRTMTLAGTFILGTAAIAFAAGTGGSSGAGGESGSHTTTAPSPESCSMMTQPRSSAQSKRPPWNRAR